MKRKSRLICTHQWDMHTATELLHVTVLSVGMPGVRGLPLVDVAQENGAGLCCCNKLLHVRCIPALHVLAHALLVFLRCVVGLLQATLAAPVKTFGHAEISICLCCLCNLCAAFHACYMHHSISSPAQTICRRDHSLRRFSSHTLPALSPVSVRTSSFMLEVKSAPQMGIQGFLHKAAGECFSQHLPCLQCLCLPTVRQAAVCRLQR